ncbi:MAG TPA: type II toxin-antitoxin system prevent-host-death family antitoxin [Gammaproteobacteria bacterium]|nr:type II toxin-antitoxin system prevent-host-death family antitoxin [Gammaproteobacteria bacterium]
MPAQIINVPQFKAICLQLMDEVQRTGEEIIITKKGKLVSKLAPIAKKPDTLFGAHRGQIKITDDIVRPLDVEREVMQ